MCFLPIFPYLVLFEPPNSFMRQSSYFPSVSGEAIPLAHFTSLSDPAALHPELFTLHPLDRSPCCHDTMAHSGVSHGQALASVV